LQPVGHPGLLGHQLGAVAGQFPKLPLGPGRDKTRLQQPGLEQLRQPLAVLDVRLPSGDVLHMAGVHQQEGKAVLQKVVDGLPIDSGGLHGHMRHSCCGQPIGHLQEVPGHGAKGPSLLVQATVRLQTADTGRHAAFMHVQTATPGVNDLHGLLPMIKTQRRQTSQVQQSVTRAQTLGAGNILEFVAMSGPDCSSSSRHHRKTALSHRW
jgi:hypothetical protein